MPALDGLAMLSKLNDEVLLKGVPVVILTGCGLSEDELRIVKVWGVR
jgi:hypothetical protein